MGDIADMILDGTLDEETGEYIGNYNRLKYGTETPGFPVSIERELQDKQDQKARNIAKNAAKKKTKCPVCRKRVKEIGLSMHMHDVHGL